MSREGQLSASMQVDDEASVNCGASLGEGSTQGNVSAQSESRPDLTDLLSRGRSAIIHRRQEGEQSRLILCFVVGEAQHRVKKLLGRILQSSQKN